MAMRRWLPFLLLTLLAPGLWAGMGDLEPMPCGYDSRNGSTDPKGYVDGKSLYRAYFSPNALDPSGKETYIILVKDGEHPDENGDTPPLIPVPQGSDGTFVEGDQEGMLGSNIIEIQKVNAALDAMVIQMGKVSDVYFNKVRDDKKKEVTFNMITWTQSRTDFSDAINKEKIIILTMTQGDINGLKKKIDSLNKGGNKIVVAGHTYKATNNFHLPNGALARGDVQKRVEAAGAAFISCFKDDGDTISSIKVTATKIDVNVKGGLVFVGPSVVDGGTP